MSSLILSESSPIASLFKFSDDASVFFSSYFDISNIFDISISSLPFSSECFASSSDIAF